MEEIKEENQIDEMFEEPSGEDMLLAQIDASVFLSDHFSFAISPSVIFNRGDFLGGSSYQSSNIRILSIGASWNF